MSALLRQLSLSFRSRLDPHWVTVPRTPPLGTEHVVADRHVTHPDKAPRRLNTDPRTPRSPTVSGCAHAVRPSTGALDGGSLPDTAAVISGPNG